MIPVWGWRARIGFIIPCSDLVQEPDAYQIAPRGVTVHFTRIPLPQPFDPQELKVLGEDMEKPLELLKPLQLNVIVFGCTSGSFIGGPGYDGKIASSITKISGVKGTTTSSSVIAALKALKLKKISVLAPYSDDVGQKLKLFLEANGIRVLKMKTLGLNTDLDIARVSPEAIYQHAKEIDLPKAEGLFISCTTFRAIDIIHLLENDISKPIITANQAAMWNALRIAGIKDKIQAHGQLFTRC